MRCASTRARSDFKVRRETGLFTGVGLTHAEDVANRTTRRVAHHDDPAAEQSEADDTTLAIVLAKVIDFDGRSSEYELGIFEVEAALDERLLSLGRIVGDAHMVIVSTITDAVN